MRTEGLAAVKEQATSGTSAHLDFYLDRGCTVVPCRTGTKQIRKGSGEWTAEDSRTRRDELCGNAALRNGTGSLLVVDIDAKNGGSLDVMAEWFPGSTLTRTVQTVSPDEHGRLGLQLVYALPDGFTIGPKVLVRNAKGTPMIEVAAFAMLPGSRARGADGVMRTYEVVRDISLYPPTPELLAAVEGRVVVESAEPATADVDPAEARTRLDGLLARIAAAGDGQRNDVFTQYAIPAVRLCAVLGEDPETVLTTAYEQSGGVEPRWVKSAVRSAIRRAAVEDGGRLGLGPLAVDSLDRMRTWARYAPWPGQSGPSDRRVFLAVIGACLEQGRTDTGLGKRKLAIRAGVSEETVEASLKRLEDAGRLEVLPLERFHVRRPQLLPDDTNTHMLPPLVRENIYTGNTCEGVDPLHMVWSVPKTDKGLGLDGRHGQLFDLVCAGLTTARALSDYVGSRQDSVKRTLGRLTEVYLLAKIDGAYIPAANATELADRLALGLGGVEVCAHRENRYRDEAKRWSEEFANQPNELRDWIIDGYGESSPTVDDEQLSAQDQARIVAELEGDERRDWYEEQELYRLMGQPNELGY
ncbi:bifunctional DNA primase/polymerase [Nocardia yunnanensis]|nr:bifunctional DNA primase/polymerase [Nocardia yunnanensis]